MAGNKSKVKLKFDLINDFKRIKQKVKIKWLSNDYRTNLEFLVAKMI